LPVTINGSSYHLRAGITVLEAAQELGIRLPDLCHDPRISPSGSCRLCLIEIDGHERPLAACQTPISEGIDIRTHTPQLEAGRKAILEMLARRYPAEALAQEADQPFHQWLQHYGVTAG
jgi:formate dehydrogenase major subunit